MNLQLKFPCRGHSCPPSDDGEQAHLIFMREEEKLARDVYYTLGNMYSTIPVFKKIAQQAEQTHTDSMLEKLTQFGMDDPVPFPGTLPDEDTIANVGIFAGFFFKNDVGQFHRTILWGTSRIYQPEVEVTLGGTSASC